VKYFFWLAVILLFCTSCRKDSESFADVRFQIKYESDGKELIFDTLLYDHPAGYKYSVSRIQFLISGLEAYSMHTQMQPENVWFIDGAININSEFQLHAFPCKYYDNWSLTIGLDSNINKTGKLGNSEDFLNMAWPETMGGGYHFLKLEGMYKDSTGIHGYAIHIGGNGNEMKQEKLKAFTVKENNNEIILHLNVNEFFKNPELYDFNKDGNYIMGYQTAMKKIAVNGRDVMFHD